MKLNQKIVGFKIMFCDILDENRKSILPLLKNLKSDFYLAGGTALALQLGHRDSIDFDFFTENDLDTGVLLEKLQDIFKEYPIKKIQEEKNTLTIIVDDDIKLSFFTYKYPLVKPLIEEEFLRLASVEDIASMKLSAIVSRATEKDYVDLYFILQEYELADLLKLADQKFPSLDEALILKSLTYFDDVVEEEIVFKHQQRVSFVEVKTFLKTEVQKYLE